MSLDTDVPATGRGGSPSLDVPDYWWYRVRAELLRRYFGERARSARRVLDVGSADGPSVSWLGASELKVCLDVDPRGLRPGGVCGSALALPFRDGCFDVVAAFDVIEHCDPEGVAVGELVRVLRPGGTLMIAVPAYQWAWSDHDVANGHHRRYTRGRLVAALEAAGVEVDRASYAFAGVFPVFAIERTVRRLARRARASGAADVVEVPQVHPAVECLLCWLSRLDSHVIGRRNLPFGSSVFAIATKPE